MYGRSHVHNLLLQNAEPQRGVRALRGEAGRTLWSVSTLQKRSCIHWKKKNESGYIKISESPEFHRLYLHSSSSSTSPGECLWRRTGRGGGGRGTISKVSRQHTWFPPRSPSQVSSSYGLFCKAPQIYKIKWVGVFHGRPKTGERCGGGGGSVPLTIIQRIEASQELSGEQQSALNLHHLKWFFFSLLLRGGNDTNKYSLGYEHTIYTSTIKWKNRDNLITLLLFLFCSSL